MKESMKSFFSGVSGAFCLFPSVPLARAITPQPSMSEWWAQWPTPDELLRMEATRPGAASACIRAIENAQATRHAFERSRLVSHFRVYAAGQVAALIWALGCMALATWSILTTHVLLGVAAFAGLAMLLVFQCARFRRPAN
jgi:hypothetical protein